MTVAVALRPAQPEDADFQFAVYASTRASEMALVSWSADKKQVFLEMQFGAQRQHYSRYYPEAEYSIILGDHVPVGRLIVNRAAGEILLIDIALLPEHQNGGIGTGLIQELMAEAREAGRRLRLHVETFNPALRLYERLGFTRVAEMGLYYEMEYGPIPPFLDTHMPLRAPEAGLGG